MALVWSCPRSSSLRRRSASKAAAAAVSWIGDVDRSVNRAVLYEGSSTAGVGEGSVSSRDRLSGLAFAPGSGTSVIDD